MFATIRRLAGLAALAAILLPALAQADPSARVGRIALLDGPTLFRVNRDDAGSAASLNWPITGGAILDTEQGSRAEVWIGSTAYRLGSESRVEFAAVDDRSVTVQQAAGTLAITIRDRDQADDIEVRTPNGRVQFAGPGRYRIDVGAGRTNVAATSGNAYVYGRDRSATVDAGRTASIDGNGDVALYGQSLHDGFDDWVADREAATRPRVAQRYVSPAMTGYQDLDSYGDWGSAPDYGSVWYPRAVPMGWAPYRQGRWAWIEPWGWTWVDAAPWGFAPFHYGRWVEIRGRWGWIPGSYVARPVYAPALVGWIGSPGWSVSLSVGSGPAVGWFPLAPREVYVPVYRSSPAYVRQINVTHITNVTVIDRAMNNQEPRHFAHRDSPRAVTVVPANSLRDGSTIRASAWSGRDRRELREAPVSARAPTSNWLAPTAAASRPTMEQRHDNGRPGQHSEALPGMERSGRPGAAPLAAPGAPAQATSPTTEPRRGGFGETRPATEQRPLPPGIDRLPAQPRSDRNPGETSHSPTPAMPHMTPAAPTTNVPAERPRSDVRSESRPPSVSAGFPERNDAQAVTRPATPAVQPERPRYEGRQAPGERSIPPSIPQERQEVRPAPAVQPERPRFETRQAVPERSAPLPAPVERHVERPMPTVSEPPRQREMPAVQPMRTPQPQAMPQPQMEHRAPPMENRRPEPQQREGRHEHRDQGSGSRMQ